MTADTHDPRVFTWTSGSEVTPVRVDWWEHHLIPRGCLTVPAGRGNAGKSTACAAWAAEATNRGEVVAWLHSEEDRAMHITPKMLAAGADLDLIKFLDVGIQMEDGTISEASLQLPRDIDRLEEGLVALDCRFVVFDALTSFKSSRMSANSGDDVRAFLEPIQRMAGRLNAVVLGIAHLGKDGERKARDAVKGASEWTDVPRQVLAFHREDGETEGVISDVKGNLSPSPRSIGYRFENISLPEHGIDEVGRIIFTGDVETSVDDARRSAANTDDDEDDRSEALRWVEDYLEKNGETDSVIVKRAGAKELGTSIRTIERAARAKGSRVVPVPRGFPRKSFWKLADIVEGEVISGDTVGPDDSGDTPYSSQVVATVATDSDQAEQNVATDIFRSSDTRQNNDATVATDGGITSRPSVVDSPEPPVVNTPGRAPGQWLGSGKPVEPPKLTCAHWLRGHVLALMADDVETIESRDLFAAGEHAGFGIDNLRRSVMNCDLIATVGRTGHGATYRLGAGNTSTVVSCPEWLDGWLREQSDWVKAADAFAAGDAAGYSRMTVKSAAKRIGVLKRGQSILTEWKFNPDFDNRESA